MSEFPCRLYLTAPFGHPLDVLTAMLTEALATNDVAAVLFSVKEEGSHQRATTLMRCAMDHDAAFIVAEDIAFAGEIGADGVHITGNIEAYKNARSKLGEDRIIGLATDINRHESMCFGEVGADYIFFDADLADENPGVEEQSLEHVIGWWSELFEVPCVSWSQSDMAENRALIDAGVDFLCLRDSMWNSQEIARQTLKSIKNLIAECGRGQ